MVVFKKENGDLIILHNHSFSIVEMKHRFDIIYIFPSVNGKVIREEKGKEVEERD